MQLFANVFFNISKSIYIPLVGSVMTVTVLSLKCLFASL